MRGVVLGQQEKDGGAPPLRRGKAYTPAAAPARRLAAERRTRGNILCGSQWGQQTGNFLKGREGGESVEGLQAILQSHFLLSFSVRPVFPSSIPSQLPTLLAFKWAWPGVASFPPLPQTGLLTAHPKHPCSVTHPHADPRASGLNTLCRRC